MGHSVQRREEGGERSRDFAPTHWSVVLAAASATDERRAAALETLCNCYWEPLYTYVRQLGYAPEDAQDLTQGFLLGADAFKTVWQSLCTAYDCVTGSDPKGDRADGGPPG